MNCRLADVELVFFGGHTVGMWKERDADAMVGLTPVQREAQALRRAANVAAGFEPDDIAGVAGRPIVEYEVSPEVRAMNLKLIQDDQAILQRKATQAAGRVFLNGEKPRAVIFTGQTGVGKSRTAFQEFPQAFRWNPDLGGASNWIDGYTTQEVILIDEFYDVERGRAKVPFSEIKMMLDWYPFTYQTKATPYFVPILAKTFVFTSCVPPELWYVTESGETEPEWARRLRDFGDIRHLGPPLQAAD